MVDFPVRAHRGRTRVSEIAPRAATIGITRFHIGTQHLEWDSRAAFIFGDTGDTPSLDVWRNRVHPDDSHLVSGLFADAITSVGAECVYRIRMDDGEVRFVLTRSVGIERGPGGEPEVLTGVVVELDPALGSEALLTKVLDHVSVGFVVLDQRMHITYINSQSERHLDVRRVDVVGRHLYDALPRTRDTYLGDLHRQALETEQEVRYTAESMYIPNTTLEVIANYVDGAVAISFRDISAEVTAHSHTVDAYRELLEKSRLDDLTGVLNRSALLERITPAPAALLFIDIDHFKTINDTYGHLDGDKVLRATARRLEKQCGPGTALGRIGGDEFVAAVFDSAHLGAEETVDRLVRDMHRASRAPIALGHRQIEVSVSIGIAHNRGSCSVEELLTRADCALYRAKAGPDGSAWDDD